MSVRSQNIEDLLRDAGLEVDADLFWDFLRAAFKSVIRSRPATGQGSSLTAAEIAELDKGGMRAKSSLSFYSDARAKTAAHLTALLTSSLTTADAAKRLGVDASRVRQMLLDRSLLGFKNGNEWRVLDLQFAGDHLVPNIGAVSRALPAELPVVAIANWLTTPEADLERNGEPVSPIVWLAEGGDARPVAALAADL
jgi:hypothetical protein